MKSLSALIVFGCWLQLGPTQVTDIHAAALEVITQARTMAPPATTQSDGLTDSERDAVGRYFETPSLEEVYPGLKGTTPDSSE